MTYRVSLLLAVAVVGVLALSSSASASTMSESGTTITWTGGSSSFTPVGFNEFATEELTIWTSWDPVEYDDSGAPSSAITADCDDIDGDPTVSPASEVLCTDVDVIKANGGPGDDSIDGSGDGWFCCGPGLLTILAEFDGGLGEDDLYGGYAEPTLGGGDTLDGGQGDDEAYGNDGEDDITLGDDDDFGSGGDDDDEVDGGNGGDSVHGDDGDDLVHGGDGDDEYEGDDGADNIDGGDGNDFTSQHDDGSVDIASGGSGTDKLEYRGCWNGCSANDDVTITDTQSAAAAAAPDDGDTEEDPGNDFTGHENIDYDMHEDAHGMVVTGDATNAISGTNGIDTMTPGNGPDFLTMEGGDDTANTVDGFPDLVDCGEDDDHNDTDTANADQFDELHNCEDENITEVKSAFEDPDGTPPNVRLTAPADGARLPASRGTALTATANDDVGVVNVFFLDDNAILCTDSVAPYECTYEPTSGDVGRNSLSAWAVDANGQFGADFAEVTVRRFNSKLRTRTNKRDLKGRRTVRAGGDLELADGVSAEDGCEGKVRIKIKDGGDTLRKRTTPIEEDCSWKRAIKLPGIAQIAHDKVKVMTKFLGNDLVQKDRGPKRKTKVQ